MKRNKQRMDKGKWLLKKWIHTDEGLELKKSAFASFYVGQFISSTVFISVDIDTIEIRSDEEEGSGASKVRRTYNYRVRELWLLSCRKLYHFYSINTLFQFSRMERSFASARFESLKGAVSWEIS